MRRCFSVPFVEMHAYMSVVDSKRNLANSPGFQAMTAQHFSHESSGHQHHAYLVHPLFHIGRSGGEGTHKGNKALLRPERRYI